MSRRKVTVMLHDLRAAYLVQCYKSINESDFRREITGWRRSPHGDEWLRILDKPPWMTDEMAARSRRHV